MANDINLNGATKLIDILTAYPWIKEQLPRIHEKFKMIQTPLAKVMLKTVTISDMSKRSGMDETSLIEKIKTLIIELE